MAELTITDLLERIIVLEQSRIEDASVAATVKAEQDEHIGELEAQVRQLSTELASVQQRLATVTSELQSAHERLAAVPAQIASNTRNLETRLTSGQVIVNRAKWLVAREDQKALIGWKENRGGHDWISMWAGSRWHDRVSVDQASKLE